MTALNKEMATSVDKMKVASTKPSTSKKLKKTENLKSVNLVGINDISVRTKYATYQNDTRFFASCNYLVTRDCLVRNKSSEEYVSEILFLSFVLFESDWNKLRSNINRSKSFFVYYKEQALEALKTEGLTEKTISGYHTSSFAFDITLYDLKVIPLSNGHVHVVYSKKNDMFAKDKSSELNSDDFISPEDFPINPIIIFDEDDHLNMKKRIEIYNAIRKSTVRAMLTDMTEPISLAAQMNALLYYTKSDNGINMLFENGSKISSDVDSEFFEKGIDVTQEIAAKYIDVYLKKTSKTSLNDKELKHFALAEELLNHFFTWVDYFFYKFLDNGMLKPANTVISTKPIQLFELIIDHDFVSEILSDGLKLGSISFGEFDKFNNPGLFNDVLQNNSPLMVNMLKSTIQPIHKKGDVPLFVKHSVKKLTDRQVDPAQLEAIAAGIKAFNLHNSFMLLGEPGVGKTIMSILTVLIHSTNRGKPAKILVVCPPALQFATWKEELLQTVKGFIYDKNIHNISKTEELMDLERKGIFEDEDHHFVIVSEANLKNEYSLQPAVNYSKSKKGFTCPSCGELITHKVANPARKDDPSAPAKITVPRPYDFFNKKKDANSSCPKCETSLWMPINPLSEKKKDDFLYLTSNSGKRSLTGFYPADGNLYMKLTTEFRSKLSASNLNKREEGKIKRLLNDFEECFLMSTGKKARLERQSSHKVSISSYVEKKLRHKFTHLIIDEAHEYQNISKRFKSIVSLIKSIRFVLCATGTSMNGYPKSRFHMDFALFPHILKHHGFNHNDVDKYQKTFGVTEEINKFKVVDGKEKKLTPVVRNKPGISPIIFALFMQRVSVFIHLTDLNFDLPNLSYEQIEVPLSSKLKAEQEEFSSKLRALAREDEIDFVSAIQTNVTFLDMPQKEHEIYNRDKSSIVYTSTPVEKEEDAKLNALMNYLDNEINVLNRKTMVYTQWVGDGINEYLHKAISEKFNVTLLSNTTDYSLSCDGTRVKVKKEYRMDFIKSELAKGTQCLIVSPSLVKTGLNLIEFPTIIYYQLGYQVYTLRQADKRSHRIGQTQDCKIVYMYYKGTFQNDIARIMSTKIFASQAIEGKMDAAGLEAILNERTPEEELQKLFYEGLKNVSETEE